MLKRKIVSLELKNDGSWGTKIKQLRIQHENDRRTEENEANNGYIIETDVSYEEYIKNAVRLLDNSKVRVFFINGQVLIYEFPVIVNEVTSDELYIGIRFNNNFTRNSLGGTGSSDINFNAGTVAIPNNVSYQPDQSILPNGRVGLINMNNLPYPTLVVEVGYSQSLQSLHTKALQYLNANTDIQMVICVSIWPRRPNNTFQALVLLYRRGFAPGVNPEDIISFGTAPLHHDTHGTINGWNLAPNQLRGFGVTINGVQTPACNQAGMAQYTLQIPSADLYHGVPLAPSVAGLPPTNIPAGVPANIPLDLFNLQTRINNIPIF
ncbi:hypothetical protein DLAC_06563 [Tieghemostelium lacteum]|uniref:Restriction endonuclease domain-containing protein n=1 Tax=Tieghemostelium lacteum TaxID=361077 RepID=A0A151ZFC9_TIELA|nr:hypothetical protein DLAC_06563 [Tieghemostelium lacteum]|eukprot:KYQ92574.1 hypothetical protein DLAC_06563 [Tieghemostelium lacteum]